MADINLNIEVSALKVNVGPVELRFLTTKENIARIVEMAENEEGFKSELFGDINDEYDQLQSQIDNGVVDSAVFKRTLELDKLVARRSYDVFFGEGAFEQVYEQYPDVAQLMAIYPTLIEVVSDALSQSLGQKEQAYNATKQRILAQKYAKRNNGNKRRKK